MKNTINKLDFGVIVVRSRVEVHNHLSNCLRNRLDIKIGLVSSLEEQGLSGVCDPVFEANEYL